jgi:2,3-bisphosphoglycerate-independent phosphoglycerate mutase
LSRLLLLFADGVGLGGDETSNPFVGEPSPALRGLLGGPLVAAGGGARGEVGGAAVVLAALDAVLGVPGLPQSGTGQTTLFTGVNAQAAIGHHVPALPGPRLRALLDEHSVLKRLAAGGLAVTFANAYTADYAARLAGGESRGSATTYAVLAAGLALRTLADLDAGTADEELPGHVPGSAGRHRFTLYETFLTDLAGHGRWGIRPADAVARLDGLLAGVLAARPADLTVLLTSDHGNLEEPWHKSHTANLVPLLAVGPAAPAFADLVRLDEVTPRILAVLGSSTRPN